MGKGFKRIIILNFMIILAVTGYCFGRYVLGDYLGIDQSYERNAKIEVSIPY